MKRRKITIEFVRSEFTKEGYTLLSTEYVNAHQKLKYKCPKGHYNSITWGDWSQGHRCSECAGNKKLTIELIQERFAERGYILLTKIYTGNQQKLEYICNKGHHCSIRWGDFQRGVGCPECSHYKKPTIESICKEFAKVGYQLLSTVYVNNKTLLEYICNKGHHCNIRWNDFQQGNRCPICYLENNRGSNHPNFNPNLTYKDRIRDRLIPGYIEWAYNVKKRDNFTCQVCGDNRGGNLVSHHLYSYRSYPALQLVLSNGICLCEPCHKLFHHLYGYGNNTRKQFEEFKKKFAAKRKSQYFHLLNE